MQRNVFSFIWKNSRRDQILILVLTVISFPFLYYSLELPKIIVNEAIQEYSPTTWFGVTFDQIEFLMVLSGIFLALMVINGAFKYYINVYRGLVGERMLQRFRYQLYERVLRFRLPRFKKMSAGEIIPMITAEVEPVGGFAGDAFALPAFQGGTLLVYLAFIFIQDPILGAAAVSLFPIQAYVIPKLQWHVNQLGKQRVRTVRQLADKIGESVAAAGEIHANDTSAWHRGDIAARLTRIYTIRFDIFKRKFFIKFLNNFLNQLTPFFFYSIGGYLVIVGRLELGALVAILAAYKDIAAPWRELLTYYQRVEDVRIKYDQVIEQFVPPDLLPLEKLDADPPFDGPLPDSFQASHVGYAEDGAAPVLESVSGSLPTKGVVALVGGVGSGRDEFATMLAGLIAPTSGRLTLGDRDVEDLPESTVGRRIVYLGTATQLLTDTLWANIVYGLKNRPGDPKARSAADEMAFKRNVAIAQAAGTPTFDMEADWIDYRAIGAHGPEDLRRRVLDLLARLEMADDVYRMGLTGPLSPRHAEEAGDRVLAARRSVRERLGGEAGLSDLVELFDPERFNESASVAENVLFGVPIGPTFQMENVADSAHMRATLDAVGLTDTFLDIGKSVAETMIELFADLPPGHEFFEQFSFISSEDLPEFQPILAKIDRVGFAALDDAERSRIMALPFRLIPSRHRLGLIDADIQEKLVEARRRFAKDLPDADRDAVAFFDPDAFNPQASIQDNILFGKVRYGQSANQDRVLALIAAVVDEQGLREVIATAGLDQSVGIGGSRLAPAQRQKLALVRALLKRPDLLILHGATSALDGGTQSRILAFIRSEEAQVNGVVLVPHRTRLAEGADEIWVFESGRVVEKGDWPTLTSADSRLNRLLDQD